jgi:hypothetical protein
MAGENNNNLFNLYGSNGSLFQNLKDYNTSLIQGVGTNEATDPIQKNRINTLNENYLEKRNNYKKILIAILIACFIYFILICISKWTTYLSPTIVDILFIIIFIITTFYCFKIFYDIYRRNNIYYDRFNLNPPSTLDSSKNTQQDKSNLLGSNLGKCIGEDCCIKGVSYWDPGTIKCIPTKTSADTATNSVYLYTPSAKTFVSSCVSGEVRCGYSCVPEGTTCYLSPIETSNLPAPTLS